MTVHVITTGAGLRSDFSSHSIVTIGCPRIGRPRHPHHKPAGPHGEASRQSATDFTVGLHSNVTTTQLQTAAAEAEDLRMIQTGTAHEAGHLTDDLEP